jgi:hypothetical protein
MLSGDLLVATPYMYVVAETRAATAHWVRLCCSAIRRETEKNLTAEGLEGDHSNAATSVVAALRCGDDNPSGKTG